MNSQSTSAQSTFPKPNEPAHGGKFLVAASGTGGHIFPALAIAQTLEAADCKVEWLGVKNRLETRLVPQKYPLRIISVEGFQHKDLRAILVLIKFLVSIWQTRRVLKAGDFRGVVTTGGYIAAPAIIAAKTLGLPSVLHEANALPGKVTRALSQWCNVVALGFEAAAQHLPKAKSTVFVGTPVRESFLSAQSLDLAIPDDAPLIVVVGGSQGAVGLNRAVRACAEQWIEAGAWVVHLTGDRDPEAKSWSHPHYLCMEFFDNMAGLFQRATLAVSRAGAGSITELAITGTPAVLIPYPYAAEDHQTFNAKVFVDAGAGVMLQEKDMNPADLENLVLSWLAQPKTLEQMSQQAKSVSVPDSTTRVAALIQ
ncbi:MAG: undecaprenyldiphospho-muramoylpentapeptide beta-N-acetylglucosaminyltransferase [Cyanobacteria bacterium P01_F01_bin.42]